MKSVDLCKSFRVKDLTYAMGEDYKFIIVMNGKAIEPTNREDILRARYALVDKFYIRNDGNDVVVLIDCSESPKYMIV